MIYDRDYYRCKPDSFLLEEAKYAPNKELCIVLAERFSDALRDIDKLEQEAS